MSRAALPKNKNPQNNLHGPGFLPPKRLHRRRPCPWNLPKTPKEKYPKGWKGGLCLSTALNRGHPPGGHTRTGDGLYQPEGPRGADIPRPNSPQAKSQRNCSGNYLFPSPRIIPPAKTVSGATNTRPKQPTSVCTTSEETHTMLITFSRGTPWAMNVMIMAVYSAE